MKSFLNSFFKKNNNNKDDLLNPFISSSTIKELKDLGYENEFIISFTPEQESFFLKHKLTEEEKKFFTKKELSYASSYLLKLCFLNSLGEEADDYGSGISPLSRKRIINLVKEDIRKTKSFS